MKNVTKLRIWELSLLLGVAIAALLGAWLHGEQQDLADKVIRLHVIAASDTPEDQALKLTVRDAILEEAGALFQQGESREEAERLLEGHLEDLAAIGYRAIEGSGRADSVTVSLRDNVWFPTKEYGGFSLPAGSYTALQVVIGAGEGQNWWCVVFPPLCLESAVETAAQTAAEDGLSEEQIRLVTGESEGYLFKFRAIELWEEFLRLLPLK